MKGSGRSYDVSINRVDKNACPDKLNLLISVVDNTGDPVTTLVKDDFRLFENSSEIGPINLTWSQVPVSAPISVGLVLDYSSSTIPITSEIEAAAKSFVDELKAGVDEAEVMKFDKDVFAIQGFTTDKPALISAIESSFPDADRYGERATCARPSKPPKPGDIGPRAEPAPRRRCSRRSCSAQRHAESKVATPLGPVPHRMDYSDWRAEQGVRIPHAIKVKQPGEAADVTLETVEAAGAIDPAVFARPAG